jgi:hypothetical protein
MNELFPWIVAFGVVLALYLYVRSRRMGGNKKK